MSFAIFWKILAIISLNTFSVLPSFSSPSGTLTTQILDRSAQLHLVRNVRRCHHQRFSAFHVDEHKTKCFQRKQAKEENRKAEECAGKGGKCSEAQSKFKSLFSHLHPCELGLIT